MFEKIKYISVGVVLSAVIFALTGFSSEVVLAFSSQRQFLGESHDKAFQIEQLCSNVIDLSRNIRVNIEEVATGLATEK